MLKKIVYASLISLTTCSLLLPAIADKTKEKARDKSNQGHPRHMDPAKMAEMHEKRMNALHDKLKLKPEQEAAWQSYVQKTKPQAPPERPDHGSMANMKAPERMEKMLQMMRQRQTHMEAHLAALKEFYAQLTPDQQAVLDKQAAHGRSGHGGPGNWGRDGKERPKQ